MREWQPIDTGPKDGSRILLYHPAGSYHDGKYPYPEHIMIGYWWIGDDLNGPRWDGGGANVPTHWMPLPPVPLYSYPKNDGESE